ncbi:hypothetical protein RA8CHR_01259 [Variovorax sp. RA8]|nr:hypothetical protein RA8CHR_01259 [Variovorax sp. RA8]
MLEPYDLMELEHTRAEYIAIAVPDNTQRIVAAYQRRSRLR